MKYNFCFKVADFSENEAPKRQLHLDSLFDYPEFLDRFRTQVRFLFQFPYYVNVQVNYCVRLRRVTEEEMEFAKYRTLTKVNGKRIGHILRNVFGKFRWSTTSVPFPC